MKTLYLMILFTLPVFGRIGETKETCVERYGPIVKEGKKDDPYTVHEKAGFKILITYWQGKAVLLYIRKSQEDDLGKPLEMSEVEMKLIMRNNNGGKDWVKKPYKFMCQPWECETKVGEYLEDQRALLITTKEYSAEMDRRKAEAEKKNLQGF